MGNQQDTGASVPDRVLSASPTEPEVVSAHSGNAPSRWWPIETCPKVNFPVFLKSPQYEPNHVFVWNGDQWETRVFAVAASYPAFWAKDAEQPTHWRPAIVDQSPEGRDATRLDAQHAGAVAKPIAKTSAIKDHS